MRHSRIDEIVSRHNFVARCSNDLRFSNSCSVGLMLARNSLADCSALIVHVVEPFDNAGFARHTRTAKNKTLLLGNGCLRRLGGRGWGIVRVRRW